MTAMRTDTRTAPAACAAALGAAALLAAAPAQAHHSFAMFDMANNVTIEGVVAEVQWTNPHAWIEVDVPGADGEVVRWGVEFNSPNNLSRQGWRRSDISAGDHVVFVVSPLRDGKPAGLFYEVTLPSGEIKRDPRAQSDLARLEAAQGSAPE
jgi:hypothetical protein